MPIFNVKTPGSFIFTSRRNGWKIYAAVAPKETEDPALRGRKQFTDTFRMATDIGVTESPAILMLGAEGIKNAISSFEDARKVDLQNERLPPSHEEVVKHQEEERATALQKAAHEADNDKKLHQLSRRLST